MGSEHYKSSVRTGSDGGIVLDAVVVPAVEHAIEVDIAAATREGILGSRHHQGGPRWRLALHDQRQSQSSLGTSFLRQSPCGREFVLGLRESQERL